MFVRGNPVYEIPEWPDIAKVVRGGAVWEPGELAALAESAVRKWDDEPWAVQFEQHWGGR